MTPSADMRVLVIDHKPHLLRAITAMLYDVPAVQVVGALFSATAAIQVAETLDCDVVLYGYNALDAHAFDSLGVLRASLPQVYIIASSLGLQDASKDYRPRDEKHGFDVE